MSHHDEINKGAGSHSGMLMRLRGRNRGRRRFRDVLRSRDGAAAIEFALLAIPYFLIVFAIIETFVAYTGEQLLANGVDTMARRLRTGAVTNNLGRTADKDAEEFRQLFCNEVSILIRCSAQEVAQADKLHLDVRSFAKFSDIPVNVPITAAGDLDEDSFGYAPGGPSTINMVRAYYKWQVVTDLVRPFITNVRPAAGGNYFLMVETAAFQNEAYP